ncbi:MAG: hypothetical protein WAR79_12580 [Melioribacteraceae bacterium]
MQNNNRTTNLILIFLLFFFQNIFSQFDVKLNFESGIYSDSLKNFNETLNSINRLGGLVKYSYAQDSSESSFLLRAGSDFYKNNVYAIKLNSSINYSLHSSEITWKGLISYNYNSYNYNSTNYSYNIFTLIGGADFQVRNFPINLLVGYSNQNLQLQNNIYYDLIFLDCSTAETISNFLSLEYGFLLQNFSVNDNLSDAKSVSIQGWNYGPKLKINHIKDLLLNLTYKFLFYNSNRTSHPSFEHQIEFVSGTFLSKNLSLFLFADFVLRKLNFVNSFSKENTIFFIPSKSENQIALRIMYSFSNIIKPYLKFGYFNDDLFIPNNKLSGLSLLGGIEVKF